MRTVVATGLIVATTLATGVAVMQASSGGSFDVITICLLCAIVFAYETVMMFKEWRR